jgi:hypothetical protein
MVVGAAPLLVVAEQSQDHSGAGDTWTGLLVVAEQSQDHSGAGDTWTGRARLMRQDEYKNTSQHLSYTTKQKLNLPLTNQYGKKCTLPLFVHLVWC